MLRRRSTRNSCGSCTCGCSSSRWYVYCKLLQGNDIPREHHARFAPGVWRRVSGPARLVKRLTVPEDAAATLFGSFDENLKHLETLFNVRIRTQGSELVVEGDAP